MKSGWTLILVGIIIIVLGFAWIILGWPASDMIPGGNPMGSESPGSTPPAIQNNSPTGTAPTGTGPAPSGAVTITPAAERTLEISSDDLRLHFLDLAFGAGNAYLSRWDPTKNNGRIVISVNGNHDSDALLLENAARVFNNMSKTNQISEQIKQGSTGDITIKFIPESGMSGIAINTSEDRTTREFNINDTAVAKISKGTIYIDANLKGDVRNYTLMRTLFYELGFVGDSDMFQDSVFSSGQITNTNLTYADQKAIEIMYAGSLTPGMTLNDVKSAVYLRS